MTQPTETTTQQTGAPVVAPARKLLSTRLQRDRPPRGWGRLLSSVVTGVATVLFSLATARMVGAPQPFAIITMLAIFGGMTCGFEGFQPGG